MDRLLSRSLWFALLVSGTFAACGGSTTINFVGDPDNTGGNDGDGGGDGDGGSDGDGGGNLGGMAGDGTGGDGGASGGSTGGGGPIVAAYCGDGAIDDGEVCDDGNERSGDGCSSSCAEEPPFACNGEPSSCTTLGNGSLDAGEECDDGNVQDGDGCASDGTIEGTCQEPVLLEVDAVGDGTATATITSTTAAGGGTAPAQLCSGLNLGAGADRVFALDLPTRVDLSLSVESDFDAIVRLYGGDPPACDPAQEGFCIDGVGTAGTEQFQFEGMGTGTLLILVDGADEGEAGEFTIDVDLCVLDEVARFIKIERLTPFQRQVTLRNTHPTCSFDLSNLGIALVDDSGFYPAALPAERLAPGAVRRFAGTVNANNPNSTLIASTPTYFDTYAASAYICLGGCDGDGSNIVDAIYTGSGLAPYNPAPPSPATFSPAPLPSLGQVASTAAYLRVAYDGVAPDFVASDYVLAFALDGDEFSAVPNSIIYGANLSLGTVSDATEGPAFQVQSSAAGTSYSGAGIGFPPAVAQPTYVRMKILAASSGSFRCYTEFGSTTANLGVNWDTAHHGFDAPVYNGESMMLGYYAANPAAPSTVWHTLEYRNVDWVNWTFDIYLDGAEVLLGASMWSTPASVAHVFMMPWTTGTPCTYAEIIAY